MTMTPIQIKQGWKEVRLGEIVTIKHGFAFKGEFFTDEITNNVLLSPGNFAIGGGFQLNKPKYYKGEIPSDYLLKKEDLVVTMTDLSKTGDTLGFPALIPINKNISFLHNQRIGLVTCNINVLKKYLFQVLKTSEYQKLVVGSATGATVRHTSPKKIYEIQITLPPLPIQDKIAEVLSTYDDLIEGNNRRIQILESQAAKIYTEWFVHYRYPGSENVPLVDSGKVYGEIPQGWEVRKLGDIADIVSGYAFKSKDFQKSGIPVIKIKNIKGNNMVDCIDTDFVSEDLNTLKLEKYILTNGDVLVAMTGATAGKAGRVCTKNTLFLNQRVAKIQPKETIFYPFCWSRLESDESQNELYDLAGGAAQPNMSGSQIGSIQLVLPTNEVLQKYNELVNPMLNQILKLQQQNQNLKKSRDLLIPQLVGGLLEA
jgi:type I restriction enzyme, S subunit